MKKILMVLIVLLGLMIPNIKAYALEDSFYEGEYISGEYIKKFRNGSGKYEQMRFFRRASDNQAVYCIELWETLSSNKIITGYDSNQYNYANMDYSVWERIMLIAYYGYGYQNHTDSKWYAITQFMIWKETSPDTNIYFTSTLNGSKIEKYQDEMNEINDLIQNHGNIPSFYNQTYQVKYSVPTTIVDTNNVLDKFDIISDVGIQASKNGNSLTFSKNSVGESQLIFANTGNRFTTSPIVYIDNNGQNLLAPGNYNSIYMLVNVNLPSTDVIVNKLDKDTSSNMPQGDAKLEATKIQLLDMDNQIIAEKQIDKNGTLTFENIGYGTYYIKEVQAGIGYLQNEDVVTLEVNDNTEPISLYNQVIKNEIILKKYLRNPLTQDTQLEEGAIFSIYNSKGLLVTTITTNNNGIATTTLPYGIYTVKQEYGAKNHSYIEDFEIEVKDDGMIQTIELYNEELTANIKIINVDDDSKLPILETGAIFKIKDLDKNQYVQDSEENDILLTTDDLGNTAFLSLSSGKYEVEQIKAVAGYYITESIFDFEITDEIEFQLDENQNRYLEIEVPNIKQKSQIEIENYIEYYLNDTLVKIEKGNDILIPIYAKEDIYSKDGIKIYEKNQLVDEAILKDGKGVTSALVFGNYYLKNSSDNRIIEIILNQLEIQKVTLVDKVYDYEEINSSENIENVTPEERQVEQEDYEMIITIPNTFIKQSIQPNMNTLLIIIGMIFINKRKKHEKS